MTKGPFYGDFSREVGNLCVSLINFALSFVGLGTHQVVGINLKKFQPFVLIDSVKIWNTVSLSCFDVYNQLLL